MMVSEFAVKVTPSSASLDVWKSPRCLYSVSIGAANTTVKDVLDGLFWTRDKFAEVAVLLGDSLYTVTLLIQEGLEETDAQQKATLIADEYLRLITKADVPVILTSQLAADGNLLLVESQITAAYESSETFRDSIDSDARGFIERQVQRGRLAGSRGVAEELARRYLLREVAIYAHLADLGWRVDAYLGRELPTLAAMMTGKIPPVLDVLGRRMNISLSRRTRTK
jgi:tRNA-dependent cyclodipeptide synthase